MANGSNSQMTELGYPSQDWQTFGQQNNLDQNATQALASQGYTPQTAVAYLSRLSGSQGIGSTPVSQGTYGNAGSNVGQTSTGGLTMNDLVKLGASFGQQAPQQQAPPQPSGPQGGSAAQMAAAANPYSAWGTQAINQVMGANTPMMINSTPSATPSGKSGVAPASAPTSYDISGLANPQTSMPSVFTARSPAGTSMGPATASQIKTGISDVPAWQTWYGKNVGQTMYVGGQQRTLTAGTEANPPQNAITPDQLYNQWSSATWTPPQGQASQAVAKPPGMTITPSAPGTAASAQAATPFATPGGTPPPAPGASSVPIAGLPANMPPGLFQAHTSALADAGKALYAHYGGDPNTASPADINAFHNHIQGVIAGAMPTSQPPLGASGAAATVPPPKLAAGGMVRGQAGPDRVPAMLTSGEFVLNRNAVNRIGVDNLQHMNNPQHYQGGGYVDDEEPREAKRTAITTSSSSAPPPAPGPDQPPPSQPYSYTPPSTPNTSQGPAWQAYAARAGADRNYLETRADPDSDVPYLTAAGYSPGEARDIASSYSGQSPGNIPGIGGVTPNEASAVGDLFSGLQKAAQTYADSIKPWTPQPSHIPDPRSYEQRGPAAQFSQQQAQNAPGQDTANEYYRLRMMGLA